MAGWVAAASLVVLPLAVVWTIELVRIQLELQDSARAVRDYISHLGGFAGASCPDGALVC